jgi:predicted RND superfamily exporter protein
MNNRVLVSVLLLGITVLFGWFASQAKFNNTLETYFFKDDLKEYDLFLEQFGTDEIIAVAFRDGDIFSTGNLRLIDTISTELEKLPHVRRVISLTTVKLVYGDGENVYFEHLMDDIPSSTDNLNLIRQKALADPFIPGTLISTNTQSTAIIAEIDHIIGEFDYKIDLIKKIRSIIQEQEEKTSKHFYLGGTSILDEAFFRYNQRDQAVFMPLMLFLIISIVYLMFRRIQLLAVPVVVVVLTIIWTYGFLVLLGYEINIITSIIPPLLMAVAISDSMHLITDYLHEVASGKLTKTEAIKHAFSNVFTPCLMTSLTTAFGLLSLLSADLAIFRQFGLVSAGGVVFAFLITIFIAPVILSVIPLPKEKYRKQFRAGFFAKILVWLGKWRKGRSIAILSVVILAIIPAVFLLGQLNVGTNSLDYFKKDDVVRQQVEWIDTHIGGTTSLEFFVDCGEENALKNPVLLRQMEQFEAYLESIAGITGVYSAVDLVKSLNRGFQEGKEDSFIIPGTISEIAQQLFIVEGSEDFEALFSEDYSKGRITARVEMDKSQDVSHRMPEIKQRIKDIFSDSYKVTPTGILYLMNRTEHYLLTTSIKSFLLAFVVISIVIIIMIRSLRLGILAMIPNLMPILFTIALMPVLNIPLDVGTTLIAAIALGLVVDDTIHFLSRLKSEREKTNNIKIVINKGIQSTGRPIIYTSIVLSLGFLTLVFASFSPLINFGILSAIVVLLAVVFDLFVLPALLGFIGLDRRKDKQLTSNNTE